MIVLSIINLVLTLFNGLDCSFRAGSYCSDTSGCLRNSSISTLEELVGCLDIYTIPHEYYTERTYNLAQPTEEERTAWADVTASLLLTDNDCLSIGLPSAISELYSISLFTENTGTSYCVLAEVQTRNKTYRKGWGTLIVPASRAAVARHLHISAPHPQWDAHTTIQATALFKATGAKTLLIPGRVRTAFTASTECVKGTPGKQRYYKTDSAHDTSELFYETHKVIRAWQAENGGCPSSSCAYIQFHGKAPSTCSSDHIFLSAGLGRSPSSKDWYTDNTQWPVKRLKSQLQLAFSTWNISLPTDSYCSLTGTKNVVGRLLNGVEDSRVCGEGSNAEIATGVFIHAEQTAEARDSKSYQAWIRALSAAFETICKRNLITLLSHLLNLRQN